MHRPPTPTESIAAMMFPRVVNLLSLVLLVEHLQLRQNLTLFLTHVMVTHPVSNVVHVRVLGTQTYKANETIHARTSNFLGTIPATVKEPVGLTQHNKGEVKAAEFLTDPAGYILDSTAV